MKAFALYEQRRKQEWKYQWSNLTTIFDWTIVLYSVLTLVFVGAIIYDSIPLIIGVLQGLPYALLLFPVYHLAWAGDIRVFYQKADSYFFLHRKEILKGLKGYCFLHSFVVNGLISILVACMFYFVLNLAAPASLPFTEWIIFFVLLRYFVISSGKLIDIFWSGWIRKWIYVLIYLVIGIIAYIFVIHQHWILAHIALLVCSSIFSFIYWKTDSFSADLEENEKRRQKLVGMIFHASEYIHVPRVNNRTKPLVFRKSQRIFSDRRAENALSELYIKYYLRNFRHVLSYFQIIFFTIGAMIFLPLWIKYGLFLAFFFFMKEWLNIVYDELATHPFLELHKGKKLLQDHFQEKVTRWLYYPACGLVGFVLLINTFFHYLLR